MSNAGFYVAAIFVAFLVFIVMRGELTRYLSLAGISQ